MKPDYWSVQGRSREGLTCLTTSSVLLPSGRRSSSHTSRTVAGDSRCDMPVAHPVCLSVCLSTSDDPVGSPALWCILHRGCGYLRRTSLWGIISIWGTHLGCGYIPLVYRSGIWTHIRDIQIQGGGWTMMQDRDLAAEKLEPTSQARRSRVTSTRLLNVNAEHPLVLV